VAEEVQLKDVDTDAEAEEVAVRVCVTVRDGERVDEVVGDSLEVAVAVLLSDNWPAAPVKHMHSNAGSKGVAQAQRAHTERDPIAAICRARGPAPMTVGFRCRPPQASPTNPLSGKSESGVLNTAASTMASPTKQVL
jgi:hypothetical protein